jgi:hypothetical protein
VQGGGHKSPNNPVAGGEHSVLSRGWRRGEAATRPRPRALVEAFESTPIDLLQPDHRPGELALAQPARALEPDTPAERSLRIERDEPGEIITRTPRPS